MHVNDFIMKSIYKYPNITCDMVGEIFYSASSHGHDNLIIDNIKFINYVENKKLKKIINNLFKNKKYDIIMMLSTHSKKITLDTFCIYEVFKMIKKSNFFFVKKFITLFPDITLDINRDDFDYLVGELYYHGIDIINFIKETCQDEKIINKYLEKFILISYMNNNLDMLKFLFETYYDEIMNCITHILKNIYDNKYFDYKSDVYTLDFILGMYSNSGIVDNEMDEYLDKILERVFFRLCKKNDLNGLIYLFKKYHDKCKNGILNVMKKYTMYKFSTEVFDLVFETY